ncbi:MAG: ShlB/FhaC/HecB family hemolysin secretion/activation protein, partial [Candidatus Tectomicrobia bacterium]|nr:ShlB/FhaC/HecB family hemolysin secretion/activation protein [Candidatus Tectomicrobia bacterium]
MKQYPGADTARTPGAIHHCSISAGASRATCRACRSIVECAGAIGPGEGTICPEVRGHRGMGRSTGTDAELTRQPARLSQRQRQRYQGIAVLAYLGWVLLASGLQAQELPGGAPLGRSGLPTLPSLEGQPSQPPTRPVLPPLPPVPAEERQRLSQQVRVLVQQINIAGNTVFPSNTLTDMTQRYVGRELTTEDLEQLRLELTRLYVEAGYVNSGAVIPDQTVNAGVITYQMIEGQLTDIAVSGTRWFRNHYIRQRLALGAGPPLNILALQERLQFLQQDERISRLDAELRPGTQRGEGTLTVQVEETNPFKVELAFNNHQSPTVGAERGTVTVTHQNVTGHADPLSVTYGRSEGIQLQLDASYSVPVTVYDTTLGVRYRRNTFTVIQEQFQGLDVESRSEAYSLTLRQPFFRTLRREFAMALSAERQENTTTLLGERFSFSPGAQNGRSVVTALRLGLEWTDRTPTQVFAARARFSFGIDTLNATMNEGNLPESRFVAWLGQLQWARQLTDWGLQAIARLDVQLTDQPLLSLEQIAVGGRSTVRGY